MTAGPCPRCGRNRTPEDHPGRVGGAACWLAELGESVRLLREAGPILAGERLAGETLVHSIDRERLASQIEAFLRRHTRRS